jgi:hypothetical protein
MLVTKYQISAINSYWEKCDDKYLGRTEGQTNRGKTVYPLPKFGLSHPVCLICQCFMSGLKFWMESSCKFNLSIHHVWYLYDACDQISDFCLQQLLRKMRWQISWTDEGQTDRGKTEYPLPIDGRNLIFGHKLHIGIPYHGKRFWTHRIPTSCLPTLLIFIHIEHICSFFVAFFSATIDGRNLIFGHKLHIGTPYRGKCFCELWANAHLWYPRIYVQCV